MKQSLYLETSVIGAYLDNGEPFRRDLTIRWWEHELSEYRAVISPLVTRELERVSEPHRSAYLKLIKNLEQVEGQVGLKLTDDVLKPLGNTWCMFDSPSGGGMFTGLTLVVSLKDARAAAETASR